MTKYNAKPVTEDGHRFASMAEHRRYRELKLLQSGGMIEGLTLQPKFPLLVNGVKIGTYIADFLYFDHDKGVTVIEDVKGVLTPVYRLKKKLVLALHGVEIVEVAA